MNIARLKQLINNLDDEMEVYVIDDRAMYQAQTNFLDVKGKQRILFSRASSTRADEARSGVGEAGGTE